jgi:hypothetical protein
MARDESIIVWTALIGQAFLDAYELLQDERYLEVAVSCLPTGSLSLAARRNRARGTCLSYLADAGRARSTTPTCSGPRCWPRASQYVPVMPSDAISEVARSAMEYSCHRQLSRREPGTTARDPRYHWFDNFHTGYNLDSLKRYIAKAPPTIAFLPHLEKRLCILHPKLSSSRTAGPGTTTIGLYPIDSQCAGQAIETLAFFSDDYPEALPLAFKVAQLVHPQHAGS